MRLFRHLADAQQQDSLASHLRRRRFQLFVDMLNIFEAPVHILDVGGTLSFWEQMQFVGESAVRVTLLNTYPQYPHYSNFASIVGDARQMDEIADHSFHLVFSNSVIEHVGELEDQQRFANEIRRVAIGYFVQTPNRYFPIEPHFLIPGFQFMPMALRIWLIRHFDLGWHHKTPDRKMAAELVQGIRLLTKHQMQLFFPEATIHRERFWGLTKSWIAYYLPEQ